MSGCTLRFARNSPLRTTLVDEVTGRAIYQIDTPKKIARSVTRIRKFDSHTRPQHWDEVSGSDPGDGIDGVENKEEEPRSKDGENDDDNEDQGDGTEPGLPGTSDEIARIYWKWFSPDRIIFRGGITTRSELLPKWGKMKQSFTFTGPDGVEYRWALGAMGISYPKLVTTDENKTVIAEFHCAQRKQKARLVVQPAGVNMLDYIILTFIFADTKRREREAGLKSSGGGTGLLIFLAYRHVYPVIMGGGG